jgi:hypothetical protein
MNPRADHRRNSAPLISDIAKLRGIQGPFHSEGLTRIALAAFGFK